MLSTDFKLQALSLFRFALLSLSLHVSLSLSAMLSAFGFRLSAFGFHALSWRGRELWSVENAGGTEDNSTVHYAPQGLIHGSNK